MDVAHTVMAGNFFEGSKAAARSELERRRKALTAEEVREKGGEAQGCLAALPVFQRAGTVALYAAQSFEVPTGLLWAGHRVCLPRVNPKGQLLSFHLVDSPAQLVARGKLGLLEPAPGAIEVRPQEIDLWVVPGVGFTPDGDRLGRGCGYYDLALKLARSDAPKIGLTFECCLVEKLPLEPHDVRMDEVITELGRRLRRASAADARARP